jgi:hypothetical protein
VRADDVDGPLAVGPGRENRSMRGLVYTAFMSLDGVVDSPGGGPGEEHRSGGWVIKDVEFLPEAFALKGRNSPRPRLWCTSTRHPPTASPTGVW